jgi:asparagine synthase (glutamine-hydrolysing)
MCGIFGSLKANKDSKYPAASVIYKYISHRGPDDFGLKLFENKNIVFAHSRLSILDLSDHGRQPMCNEDGNITIVFNGEIYNYRELKRELELYGYKFKSTSDTEVLLNLYRFIRHDEDAFLKMLNKLNGIFAFAIWDEDKDELIIVRDGLGVKPLYYIQNDIGFSFASELKALDFNYDKHNHDGTINDSLNIQAINRYLTFLWNPHESTPSKKVQKLEPGTAMWVKEGVVQKQVKWYELPVKRSVNLINNNTSVDQLITATQNHLKAAVERQMIADVPVGAFLSGGLDSSAIVTFARELNPDIKCFTIESLGQSQDGATHDLPYAQKVARHLGVHLDIVKVDASKIAQDLEAMVEQLDEPLADPAALNVVYISKLARENGIKVLLSGSGGDDLFSGYRRHRALMSEHLWSWMPQTARNFLHNSSAQLDQRNPFSRRIAKLFDGAHLNGDERIVNYFRWNSQKDLNELYAAEFKQRLGNVKAEQPMLDFLSSLPVSTHPLEKMLALEQRFFLTDHNLIYTDKMSMAVGVEVRVPFLDLELVEFTASIPAKYKQRGAEGKWILKKAMEPYLPKEIIYRPKTGFGAPLRTWIRHELRDLVNDVLSPTSILNRGIFNPIAVQKLIDDNDKGKKDAAYTIFSMMCIEIWCRKFLDNRAYTNKFA